jgi:hypothetical protein
MATDILTAQEIAEMGERADRATEGPWEVAPDALVHRVRTVRQLRGSKRVTIVSAAGDQSQPVEANCQLIANSRTDIPRLIASHEALRTRVEELEGALSKLGGVAMCVDGSNTPEFMEYLKETIADADSILAAHAAPKESEQK